MANKSSFKFLLVAGLAVALAGCGKEELGAGGSASAPQQSGASVEMPRSAPVAVPAGKSVALPVGEGANAPMLLNDGQTAVGTASAPIDGQVIAFDVQLGTFVNTSTGSLKLELCAAERCVAGEQDLLTSLDNQMFTIVSSEPLTVSAGESLTFSLTKDGGKVGVAVWTYPAAKSAQEIGMKGAQPQAGRTAKLALRFAP